MPGDGKRPDWPLQPNNFDLVRLSAAVQVVVFAWADLGLPREASLRCSTKPLGSFLASPCSS